MKRTFNEFDIIDIKNSFLISENTSKYLKTAHHISLQYPALPERLKISTS